MGENNYLNIDKPNISRSIWNKTSELMKDVMPTEWGNVNFSNINSHRLEVSCRPTNTKTRVSQDKPR